MADLVRYYPANRVGRTFVAADFHGCYRQFLALLAAVDFDYLKDVVYQTGDLINRGSQSRQCIKLIDSHWFRPVAGNHELELIRAGNDPMYNWESAIRHGARWARDMGRDELRLLTERLGKLPVAIVVGEGAERFNVFHGEWHADDAALDRLNEKKQFPVWLVDGRDLFKGNVSPDFHKGLSPSFVGHTIVDRPTMIGSHIYLDTGSYKGDWDSTSPCGITLFEPATQRAWQYSLGKVIQTL